MFKLKTRAGIAMIELIFAIVVMAIVMMSAPMLISQSVKSTQVVLQQEAIAAAASDIGMILTRHWDEGDTNISKGAPIITTLGATALADFNNSGTMLGRRVGTPSSTLFNRSFKDNYGDTQPATLTARFGPDEAVTLENDVGLDDIDDFHGGGTLVKLSEATAKRGDYVDTNENTNSGGIQLNTTVSYIDDNATYNSSSITFNDPFATPAPNSSSNIKMIEITATSGGSIEELQKEIVLKAFSCNIGSYKLEGKYIP